MLPKDAEEIQRNTTYGQLKELSKEEAVESLPAIVGNVVLQGLKSKKMNIEARLVDLSKRYKDKHPSMVALNTRLKYINDQINIETVRTLGSVKASLAGGLQVNNIRVIDYAQAPKDPIKPKKLENILTGMILSFLFCALYIYLTEQFDNSIKDQGDLEDKIGLPYLGAIPSLEAIKSRLKISTDDLADIDKDPGMSEAVRNVRTNLIFSAPENSMKTILVTSVLPQEGKSFVSSYLAFSFAKNGMKTVIVDADLRKPRLHKIFNVARTPGLVNALVENISVENAVSDTIYPNLYVMPSGSNTPNPLELLSSKKINEIITELAKRFDKIIIDTPPSFNISDALVLSKAANFTVFVTRSGMVSSDVLTKVKDRFVSSGAKIAGAVINFSDVSKNSYYDNKYYHKYYKSYYSENEEAKV